MAIRTHIAALSLAALPAFAALPVVAGSLEDPAPVAVVEPVVIEIAPLWAGGYVGAQIGYNWGDSGTSYDGETIIGGVNAGWLGLRASDLNLVTAVLVGIALMLPGVANPLRGLFKRSAP